MSRINQSPNDLPFDWDQYGHLYKEVSVPAKTILLREGDIAKQAYYIHKGCLRLSFNNNGKDISFQFFFEGQGVSSIESFRSGRPSLFSIESLEPCTLLVITKKNFEKMLAEVPGYKALIEESIYQRLEHYSALFLSHIRDTPQKRYQELLKEHPQLIQRIPQHYIASYLGITPVSLSRIRNKLSRTS
jgi:CRP-like cAMP-binding protein